MPFYECFALEGTLSADQKADLAREITRIHSEATGAPRSFVSVIFPVVRPGDLFTGGEPSSIVRIRGSIRAGRPPETKRAMLEAIARAWEDVTGRSGEDLTVSLVEFAARDTLKGGRPAPEPGEEAAWLAAGSAR